MTSERAKQIYDSINSFTGMNPDYSIPAPTAEERAEITAVWRKMPGYTCFMDAVIKIMNGEDTAIVCDCCQGTGRIFNAWQYMNCPACSAN